MPNPAAMYGGAPRLSDEMQRRALEDLLGAGVRGIGYTATAIPDAMTMLMRGVAEARPRFNKSPTEWRSDMPVSPAGDFIQGKITDAGYSDRPAAHIGGTALSMLLGAGLNKVAQAPMTAAERGMFAGIGAKTANLDELARAEAMEKAGTSADDIWQQTGWGRGADGKWRFEIDDSGAIASKYLTDGSIDSWKLSDGIIANETIDHQQLFNAYPSLGEIPTHGRVTSQLTRIIDTLANREAAARVNKTRGGYDGESIFFNAPADEVKSIGLHELQHAIQETESMNRGGNTVMAFNMDGRTGAWPIYRQLLKDLKTPIPFNEYVRVAGFDAPTAEAQASYADYLKFQKKRISPEIDRTAQETAARQYYERLAGEVEARNVQKRMNMTADERRLTPPWKTEDVPREKQIIRFRSGN